MATRSQGVQPTVWRIGEHLPDTLRFVQVLQLPAPILRSISSLEEPPAKVPPFASLNDALAALSPEIVAFHPLRAESRDERRWLYLRKGASLDCARLQTVIRVWLVACYGAQRAETLIKGWSERNWVWSDLDLQQASPEMRRMVLPGLVARWLLDQGYVLTLEENGRDVEMPLHLVPLMTQRNVAELITAPREARGEHYSFVLRFWITSMPGSVCLHARTSMRRWLDRPFVENGKVFLKPGRGKSAYLRRSTGYLETQAAFATYGPGETTVYARITMKHLGGDQTKLHWVGQQAKVFDLLSMHGTLPPVDELAAEPSKHSDQVLVVKDHHQARNQELEPGLQPADHRRVFDGLSKFLSPWAMPLPVWPRIAVRSNRRNRILVRPDTATDEDKINAALHMPHPVQVELHTSECREVKAALLQAVGLFPMYQDQLNDDSLQVVANGELLLDIVQGKDGQLTDLLPEHVKSYQARQTAFQDRRREIAQRRRPIDRPAGALVSIEPYHERWETRLRDPRDAIRLGFVDSKRVTQFFHPRKASEPEDKHKLRLTRAVSDFLRVLGFRYFPYYVPIGALPAEVDLLAPYVIQVNARRKGERKKLLPLMVEALHGDHQLRVYLPRATGSAELFLTLREAIIAVGEENTDWNEPDAARFFRDALKLRATMAVHAGYGKRPALMLVADQNMRRVFPEIDTQDIENPCISLDHALDAIPHIRVVRLRFSGDDEVAHCVPADATKGKYQGVYGHPDFPNVFFSIHKIGERHASGKWRKMDWLHKPAVNPSTVQIWLNNLQAGDCPDSWATLVHELRRASSHMDIETLYPQPLHDAQTIEAYVERAVHDEREADDLNAVDVSEGAMS